MRAPAPLAAFFLLAAFAAAASPLPEGRCTGHVAAPATEPVRAGGPPFDLRASPITSDNRPDWELLGYRIDDAAARVSDAHGSIVTQTAFDALMKPIDVSTERLDAQSWQDFMLAGYRLDEALCRLIAPDGLPLNAFALLVSREMGRRQQTHEALETLLGKLRGLEPSKPLPANVRAEMRALAKAGTELPPEIKEILKRNAITVGELRAPAAASYAASTKYFDGRRSLPDTFDAAIPARGPGAASRHKRIVDPDERVLGATLSAAFNAEISKTSPGRELLARFRGPKGASMPDVMVLKLTQSPDDPHAPGAVYDPSTDRVVINHWEIVRVLHSSLPPEKLAKIKGRLADAKQLSRLLAEDPSLTATFMGDIDVIYFHEMTHAAQARRDRMDDELLRGNLPSVNWLTQEHEAHREHCRYLLSKNAEAIDRSGWRDYCLGLIKDPRAFKENITSMYLSTFAGSSTLDDVKARQDIRRETSRALEIGSHARFRRLQKLKQLGFDLGDAELAAYRIDADKREMTFLAGMPKLRREAGGVLIGYYERTGAENRALALALSLPPGSFIGGEARLSALTEKSIAWVARDADPARRDERLIALVMIIGRLGALPPALTDAYERDARSMTEDLLAQALKARPAERNHLLDQASDWAKGLREPGDLPARIDKARVKKPK